MPTEGLIVGVLLDVSGSMRSSANGLDKSKGGDWVKSLFQVLDDMIKHDLSEENFIYSLAFGISSARESDSVIDLLRNLENLTSENKTKHHLRVNDAIKNCLDILERCGASNIRWWAPEDKISNIITTEEANMVYNELTNDYNFQNHFVNQILPPACRRRPFDMQNPILSVLGVGFDYTVTTFKQASGEDIREVISKAKKYYVDKMKEKIKDIPIDTSSVVNIQRANQIMHGYVTKDNITEERCQELLNSIEPYIYGRTPLYTALGHAKTLFYKECDKKLLFVLSDGSPTDEGSLSSLIKQFSRLDVIVVACYISETCALKPKHLYSVYKENLMREEAEKFMFALSSSIKTRKLPRHIFAKHDWTIDFESDETKLFLHVNHPDHLHSACDLAKNIVCSNDALADTLATLSLDTYINSSWGNLKASMQEENTCYANACATAMHISLKQILGREGGYPSFESIRQDLIQTFGLKGCNVRNALKHVCPNYRLQFKTIENQRNAKMEISKNRVVVATFVLYENQMDQFIWLFSNDNKTKIKILKKNDLDIACSGQKMGHAVVLTSFDSDSLTFMNSWGVEWGNNGFFQVENADVLKLKFYLVYWDNGNLLESEQNYFHTHGPRIADEIFKRLKSLNTAKYECLLCQRNSYVYEFKGNLNNVKCPKCNRYFACKGEGNILALNIYLTSKI